MSKHLFIKGLITSLSPRSVWHSTKVCVQFWRDGYYDAVELPGLWWSLLFYNPEWFEYEDATRKPSQFRVSIRCDVCGSESSGPTLANAKSFVRVHKKHCRKQP